MGTDTLSPADISAITGNNNGGMFGGDGSWWIIILFLFIFAGGWNNNGFGGNGGVQDGYILASDFSNIERKIDGVNNGLCSGFYQEAQLIANTNQNIAAGFANAELSRANQQAALMAQLNNMSATNAQCCCDIKQLIGETNYNIATQSNATQVAINSAAQAIMQNDNNNYRALHDEIVANRFEDLKTQLADKNQQINALNLAASQAAQNELLINRLQPCPVPAFPASNLYGYYNCGCNNGCGC